MSVLPIISPEKLEHVPVGALKPHDRNPRTHTKKQIRQIADSIRRFGFTNPVLIDADNAILAGHGRVQAASLIGMQTVPVLRLEHMTEAEKRAYIITDNKTAELAGWDDELLALELGEVLKLDPEFDLQLTGFDTAEIEALLNALDEDAAEEAAVEIDEKAVVVSEVGSLWQLGNHRLICGDATHPGVYARLLDGELAQMVFTDPPYNVRVNGHICGLGHIPINRIPN